ncbi:Conserved oligomeric Golgi complex subunit 4 [Hondaea fermentalgiana]|uniref:Conserved oligomeric Golgi complex subunit 4 n=1 Tax=Hondaea fermentalgiana TaxID=2315210 RepID=A0A2R5FZN5_9STRA|nr:Conserved oligomeric Golgi complex subunit 4 [Hondaea fermentalgiana]|eukprot:GBG24200.1 Conserved oligomeric Golgi complex subunit 4 [Hondaea fermentalgiana]
MAEVSPLEEVVALGTDPQAMEQALQMTLREEEELQQQIGRALAESVRATAKGEDPTTLTRLGGPANLEGTLASLDASIPTLQSVYAGAGKLEGRIAETRAMADVVSRRVREIDLARSRALEALAHVRRVVELRECLKGVKECMAREDLEAASDFVHRYRSSGVGHADGEDEAESSAEFKMREESLSRTALEELTRAFEARDEDKILKVCRVFAKLGQPTEGVSRLLRYRCDQLRRDVELEIELTSAEEDPEARHDVEYDPSHASGGAGSDGNGSSSPAKSYLDLLVHLLNQGAAVVQRTSSVVRRHISKSKDLQALVVSSIHAECDGLITKILRSFMERRRVEERARMIISDPSRLGEAMRLGTTGWIGNEEEERTEAIQTLDAFLDDAALMLKHTETYNQFIQGKRADLGMADNESREYINVVQELAGYYAVMEKTYMATAIDTALEIEGVMERTSLPPATSRSGANGLSAGAEGLHHEDDASRGKQVVVSTIAEDAFFVVDKCRDRATATGHTDSICAVVNHIVQVLEERVAVQLQGRVNAIRSGAQSLGLQGQEQFDRLRAAAFSQAQQALSATQGAAGTGAPSKSKTNSDSKQGGDDEDAESLRSPETTLNSLALCIVYTNRLRATLEAYADSLPDDRRRRHLKECVDGFLETSDLFQRTLNRGLDSLTRLIKPRLQSRVQSTVGNPGISFELTEDEYMSQNESNDPYVWAVLQTADDLLNETCLHLDLDSTQQLGVRVAGVTADELMAAVVQKRFTAFGALLLDRQLRSIVKFFDGRIGADARLRFRRLQQITDLLNLDRVEDVHDVYVPPSSASDTTALDKRAVKRALALRVDFKQDDIKRLKI